jgi:hypothetical protein
MDQWLYIGRRSLPVGPLPLDMLLGAEMPMPRRLVSPGHRVELALDPHERGGVVTIKGWTETLTTLDY